MSSRGSVEGVDFTLDEGGAIEGTVTALASGDPISSISVEIFGRGWIHDAGGVLVASSDVYAPGQYLVEALTAGTYYAATHSDDWQDELYDDLPCEGGCDPTAGTPIAVSFGVTTSGVDFVLERLGEISGTVTAAGTGQPVRDGRVRVHDGDGSDVGGEWLGWEGHYSVGPLAAGTYFVSTSTDRYLDELYDDVPCEDGCDPTIGTPIAVRLGVATSGIDFALERFGEIAGTVVDASNGERADGSWRVGARYDGMSSLSSLRVLGLSARRRERSLLG